jgi:ribosomal protein S18 acetylase RimI-like enzyme
MVKRPMLPQVKLRRHRPGDMGWVVQRHGELYRDEFGYDERFEALVAGIVAGFIDAFDVERERCWIAERKGKRLGAVFLVKKSADEAQLRLLIVEPAARGLGLGKRLVRECIRFARHCGYRKLVLWTQSELAAARGLYEKVGFRLVGKEPHKSFGKSLTGEYWELKL